MNLILPRKKRRLLWLSILYRLKKLPFISKKAKLRLYLNIEWVADKFAQEISHEIYPLGEHPGRVFSLQFIFRHIKKDQVVLDLGSGTGEIGSAIAESAKEVIGIEYDKKIIDIASSRHRKDNLFFVESEALTYLEQSTKKFDVLILSHILEHLDEPETLLLSFKKYFTYIFIEVPDFDRYYPSHYRKDLNMELIYTDGDHVIEFDREGLIALLTECGITVIEAEYRFGVQKLWCQVINA